MKIDLTDREWNQVQVGLLQSISNIEKVSKKTKFEDNPLIKQLLKLHDKIAKARGITYEEVID